MCSENFESFRVVKLTCKVLGVFVFEKDNNFKNLLALILNHVLIVLQLALLIPSFTYLFYSSDVGEVVEVLSVLFAFILNLSQYLIFIFTKSKLHSLFGQMQKIISNRTPDGFVDYRQTEEKVNRLSIGFNRFIGVLFVIVLGMPFYVAIFHAIMGTYSPSVWFLPYKVILPFDKTSEFGYAVALSTQIIGISIIGAIICLVITLFFAICWYIESFIGNLLAMRAAIDHIWAKEDQGNRDFNKCLTFALIKDSVEFEEEIFTTLKLSAEFIGGFIFSMFVNGVLWLCTALYQMLSFDIHFTQSCISAMCSTFFMFIYCFCGNLLTINCDHINDAITQSLWYLYPSKYQKFIKLIITRNQKPFFVKGFKMTTCSLETFKKLINTAASIFMLLQAVGGK